MKRELAELEKLTGEHTVPDTGDKALRLSSPYAPPHHFDSLHDQTKAEALSEIFDGVSSE